MVKGSTVYVGNIDFDVNEQKVIEELSSVGRVINFRMVFDKQTGKPKGYGFCEYESPLIAETAVQKLKIMLNNRQIKINYAEVDTSVKKENELPLESLTKVFKEMDKKNLKNCMLYIKKMALEHPTELIQMLEENKGLCIALFQALIEINFIDKEATFDLVKKWFKVDDNKIEIIERIIQMNDEDIAFYDVETQKKIKKYKEALLK